MIIKQVAVGKHSGRRQFHPKDELRHLCVRKRAGTVLPDESTALAGGQDPAAEVMTEHPFNFDVAPSRMPTASARLATP
jgi:hypothetical protein